ncbi:hypothetical protein Tco_0744397 [Tanacetum coccineum]
MSSRALPRVLIYNPIASSYTNSSSFYDDVLGRGGASSSTSSSSSNGDVLGGGGASSKVTFNDSSTFIICLLRIISTLPPPPPYLYIPPPVDRKDDVPEFEWPPRKRLYLFALGSSTIDVEARRRGIREVGYDIRDTWVDLAEAVLEITPMTETVLMVEEEAYASREAWDHAIGLSQSVHYELQTHREQMLETLRVMRDMMQEIGDMHAELLALREQQGRARQPGPDARVPDHQEASRDADSRI